MDVKFLDLAKQYNSINIDELMDELKEAIVNGQFVGGKKVEEFETNFSKYVGSDYAVGVGSGLDALIFALKGLGIGPDDEVIVPANTFIATVLAVTHVGATPVFVDVDNRTYLMTTKIESKITKKTKAIMPVHLYGNTVYMPTIMALAKNYGLFVIEDCAQAIGAKLMGEHVGTFGDAGIFSFYPAKNLGGLGQGGALVTNNKKIADMTRRLSNVGRKENSWYEYDEIGYNSRLDAVNAIFLNTGLKQIDLWTSKRREVASWYEEYLNNYPLKVITPKIDAHCNHVYHLYELRVEDRGVRDSLLEYLKLNGIGAALHYPVPCHKQDIYCSDYNGLTLPIVEDLAGTLLSLPMHPYMTKEEVQWVSETINKFYIDKVF